MLGLKKVPIKEYEPVDTIVGYLSSYDDLNDVKYSIENTQASIFFYISNKDLKTSKSFALKDMPSPWIDVKVRATDNTDPSLYVEKTLRIDVINVNDPPTLIEISNNEFDDLTAIDDVIGNLTAVDVDDKPLVRSGSYRWELTVNPNGYFKLKGNSLVLDKLIPDDNKDMSVSVTIKCTDLDQTDPKTTTVTIVLLRKNKNNPVFITYHSMSSIPESFPKGEVVGYVRAVDHELDMMVFTDLSNADTKSKFNLTNKNCSLQNDGKEMACQIDIGNFFLIDPKQAILLCCSRRKFKRCFSVVLKISFQFRTNKKFSQPLFHVLITYT